MNKLVTIIIPVYNVEKYLKECIESALNQTYSPIEVIAVDNDSTDDSMQILRGFSDKIQVYTAPNIYPQSWEEPVTEAFKHMSGDYFTILGSDDYILPNYIENCVKVMSVDKIKAFFSPLVWFNNEDKELTGKINHSYKNLLEFKQQFMYKCPVVTPTLFMRKELAIKYEHNSSIYHGAGDYWCYGKFADEGIFIYNLPDNADFGYRYRIHGEQATWQMVSKNKDRLVQQYWGEKWNLKNE